jgi:hypothetical protein
MRAALLFIDPSTGQLFADIVFENSGVYANFEVGEAIGQDVQVMSQSGSKTTVRTPVTQKATVVSTSNFTLNLGFYKQTFTRTTTTTTYSYGAAQGGVPKGRDPLPPPKEK